MKTVYLVRHAKSSWDNMDLRDIERPLNERGLRDAPFMAKLMKAKGAKPDALIASPAVRALTTAMFFKEELAVAGQDVWIRDEIYEAFTTQITSLIQKLPEDLDTVMLFGHNPTFTGVANLFTKSYIPNMPTCGVVRIDAEVSHWGEFNERTARVTEVSFPKEYIE